MAYQDEVEKIKAGILAIVGDPALEPEVKGAVLNEIKSVLRTVVTSVNEEAQVLRFSVASAHRARVASIMSMEHPDTIATEIRDSIRAERDAANELLESDVIPDPVIPDPVAPDPVAVDPVPVGAERGQ